MYPKKLFLLLTVFTFGFYSIAGYGEERKKISETERKELQVVLKTNEQLHNAFYNYDGKKVEQLAEKLNSAIGKITNPEILKLLKFSRTKLTEIKAMSSRESNNQNYHLVSMALIHIINKYDVGEGYNAYYCPHEQKKWVQNSTKMKKVHNPYNANMPHCGSQDTHY